MKKLVLIIVAVVCAGAISASAQSDTTKQKTEMKQKRSKYYDMTKVTSADVPESVRTTLQSADYMGWENSPIYKSKSGDVYMVEIKRGAQVKSYKFDSSGKLIMG